MKKTVQVLRLPTTKYEAGGLMYSKHGVFNITPSDSIFDKTPDEVYYWVPQHLYFISEEEIKLGDWYVTYDEYKRVLQYKDGNSEPLFKDTKILATTDSSLNLPLIPEWFIKIYIESNGKQNEVGIDVPNSDGYIQVFLNPKQQTVEEAAEEYSIQIEGDDDDNMSAFLRVKLKKAFIKGANWYKQQNS